jgi:restriction system protein
MDGIQFEHYVAKLLTYQGFHTEVTSGSGDLGVDIIATKSPQKYAIQVKRQYANVSRRAVSDAVGAKRHYGCNETMVITNSYFTAGAKILAESNSCRLVDRDELTDWIFAFQQEISASNPLEAQFQKWEMDEEIEKLKRKMRSFFN